MWRDYHHMNGGGEGSPPHAPAMERGGTPPPPIKGHPFPPSSSHLLVKDLSPPLELFPHGLGLARYMFGGISSGRSCCFRWIAGARRWRLSGGLNVCASADALLSCGARTSSRS